jgi:single-strand DNA-binding protein
MYQQITIAGNVGRDSELSYTSQGIAVAKFSVAVSKVTGRGDSKQEKTTWFKVTMWREKAENLSKYIKKGDKILVVGEIDASAYTNKDGQPTASLEITASDVRFMGSKDGNGSGAGSDSSETGDIPF